MRASSRESGQWLAVALRVASDMAVVQAAMLCSVASAALLLTESDSPHLLQRLTGLRQDYLTVFLPLAALFPVLYAAAGLYTTQRHLHLREKVKRSALAAAAGAAGLWAITVGARGMDGRTSFQLGLFSVLVIMGTPAIRWLKHILFTSEDATRYSTAELDKGPVLVLGGAGYIGSILVRKLLERGYSVRVLDSLVYGISPIDELLVHPRLEFTKGDCRCMRDVVRALEGVVSVVDLAAIVGDPACEQDHAVSREINYAATRMLIELSKGEHVARFIFASSCSVYGSSEEWMTEEGTVRPISVYAETKLDSERVLREANDERFHPTILRFSTIFGLSPRPRFDLVVNLLTAKAMQEQVVTIFNGEQWRPFLHVADVAECIVRTLEAPVSAVGGQVFNVGDDEMNFTLSQVAEIIQRAIPGTRVEFRENTDRRNYRVSFGKVREVLGFRKSVTLEAGVLEMKDAIERGQILNYHAPFYSNAHFLQVYGSPTQGDTVDSRVMAALALKP
ncbi:MAG: NAD(P)-dependent oxidoreductase [Acidobacteria bacterium]|nr:NAD(P)-dependent oxidoreductase [Acidobacteriota bacterium]